jgi:RNA recognition motif-containing protein
MADHRERDSYYSQTDLRSKNDDPPNSRLFVICHKSLEEDDLRKAFEKFGKIEDIWVVKDRNTGENKGDNLWLARLDNSIGPLLKHIVPNLDS